MAVQLQGGFGPQGVAAHKAQHHGHGAAAADPKQGAHDSLQQPPQIGGQSQIHRQGGEDKKGEEGGDDDIAAQGQPVFRPCHSLGGGGDQRQGGGEQRDEDDGIPENLFF